MNARDPYSPRGSSLRAALAAICLSLALYPADAQTTTPGAPSYALSGFVNAATGLSGALSPNAIASVYGTNLSWTTHAVTPGDLRGGALPTSLAGVTVYVDGIAAPLFFVSPGQINFLIPYELDDPSPTTFVGRQNVAGPVLTIPVAPVSPAFFQWNGNYAVAEHADGSLISPQSPARGGEIVVLYGDGLGRTDPNLTPGYISAAPLRILAASELRLLVAGNPCPSSSILYAGVAPGFAGLYQINLRLPDDLPANAEIRMSIGAAISPAGILLYTE